MSLSADFRPEIVRASSSAASALCTWVIAIELYANVAREVEPKRAKLKAAMNELNEKQTSLRAAQLVSDHILKDVVAKTPCAIAAACKTSV